VIMHGQNGMLSTSSSISRPHAAVFELFSHSARRKQYGYGLQSSGGLSKEQLAFFKNEDYGPDCLMELRFLDVERRQEGARYIADHRLSPRESVVLGRAMKERQRRPEAAVGFSEEAGDCLAFKSFRDAEETRNKVEKLKFVGAVAWAPLFAFCLDSFDLCSSISKELSYTLGERQVCGTRPLAHAHFSQIAQGRPLECATVA
jgi:hypothetical protein